MAEVDKQQARVGRASARVEELQEKYRRAPILQQRDIARQGFQARKVYERALADFKAAEAALNAEEVRLSQPDVFLRFG